MASRCRDELKKIAWTADGVVMALRHADAADLGRAVPSGIDLHGIWDEMLRISFRLLTRAVPFRRLRLPRARFSYERLVATRAVRYERPVAHARGSVTSV